MTTAPGLADVLPLSTRTDRATGARDGRRHLRAVPSPRTGEHDHDHLWALRDTEYDDTGLTLRRFECTDCGAVNYT